MDGGGDGVEEGAAPQAEQEETAPEDIQEAEVEENADKTAEDQVEQEPTEVRSSEAAARLSAGSAQARKSSHLAPDWSQERGRALSPEEARSVEELVERVVSQASDIIHEQHVTRTDVWPRTFSHSTPHHSNLEMITSLDSEEDAQGGTVQPSAGVPAPDAPEEDVARFMAEVSGLVQDGGSLARLATGQRGDQVEQYTVPGVESAGIRESIPWMTPSESGVDEDATRTRTANYVRRRTDEGLEWQLGSSDPESYPEIPPPPGPPTPPRQFSAAVIQYTVPGVQSRGIRGSLPWMTPIPSPLPSGEIDPRQSRRALLGEVHQWDPTVHQHAIHGVESRGARRSLPWMTPMPSPLPSNMIDPRLQTPRDSQRSFPGLWPPERPPVSESEESVGPPRQFSADVHQHAVPGVPSRGIRGSLPWMTPLPSPMPSGMVDPRLPDRARVSSDYIDFTQEQQAQREARARRVPGYFDADVHQYTVHGVESRGIRGSLPWMTPLPSPLPSLMHQLDPRNRQHYEHSIPNVQQHAVHGVESRGIRGSLPWMTPLPSPLPSDMIDPRLVEPPPRQWSADINQYAVPGVQSRGMRGSIPWMTPIHSPMPSEVRAHLDQSELTHPEEISPEVLRQMDPRLLLRMDPRVLQMADPHLARQVDHLRMRRPPSGEDIVLETQDLSDVSGFLATADARTSGYMTDHSSSGHGSVMHGGRRGPYDILPPIARGDSIGTSFIPSVETLHGSLSVRTVYDGSLSDVRRISTGDLRTPDTSQTDVTLYDAQGRPRRKPGHRARQATSRSAQDLHAQHPHFIASGYLGDHDDRSSMLGAERMRASMRGAAVGVHGVSVTGVSPGVSSDRMMFSMPSIDSTAPQTVTIHQRWYGFDWAGDWERREYEMVYHGLNEYYQKSGYLMDGDISDLTRELLLRSLDQDPYDEDQVSLQRLS